MRKAIIIAGVATCLFCTALIFGLIFTQRDAIPLRDLTISDYPKVFAKEVVIVIGENASQIERAEAIAANFGNLTGNTPEIISSKKSKVLNMAISLILSSLQTRKKSWRG